MPGARPACVQGIARNDIRTRRRSCQLEPARRTGAPRPSRRAGSVFQGLSGVKVFGDLTHFRQDRQNRGVRDTSGIAQRRLCGQCRASIVRRLVITVNALTAPQTTVRGPAVEHTSSARRFNTRCVPGG